MYGFTLNPAFDGKPLCFILYGRYYERYGMSLIEYLHKKYQNCRIVCYLGDLVRAYSFDINSCFQYFDAVFSFDKKDALDHHLLYCMEPFSFYPVDKNPLIPESDVTFIGYAKDRLKDILAIYEILEMNNLKCDFHIVDVAESDQLYCDKIIYNKQLDFIEVLQHVISSKCILEVLQSGGSSPTSRVSEAIIYGKKLLSNCLELKSYSYYNTNYISIFTDPKNIDIAFLNKNIEMINYNFMDKLSPMCMVDCIEKNLC
jgi:hypothetical protein